MKVTADTIARYNKLVSTNPKVKRKGAKTPYTSLNGNMFSFVGERGIGLRLAANECEEFRKKYKTGLYIAYGAVMREYVVVPEKLLKNAKQLKKYFDMSYAYAKTLKPKPTTKKRRIST